MTGVPKTAGQPHVVADSARAWCVLALFFMIAILSYTDRAILNVLVEPLKRDLSLSDTDVSLLQGVAFAVVYAFSGLVLGRLADISTRVRILALGVLTWSLATGLCAFARSFETLFMARMLVGVGEAALGPAVMSILVDLFSAKRRTTAISIFVAGMIMGSGFSSLAGGQLLRALEANNVSAFTSLGADAAWRQVLIVLSLFGIGLAFLVWLGVREPTRGAGRDDVATASLASVVKYGSRNAATLMLIIGAFGLATIAEYATSAWTPTTLIRVHGYTAVEAANAVGLTVLPGAALGAILGGLLGDYLERPGVSGAKLRLSAVLIISAAPLGCYAIQSDVRLFLSLYFLYSLLSGALASVAAAVTVELVPSTMRGSLVSLTAFVYTIIGLGLGPTSVAIITDQVYRDTAAVGRSIVTVVLPTLVMSAFVIYLAHPTYLRTLRTKLGDET